MGLRDTLRYGDILPQGLRDGGTVFLAFSHSGEKMYTTTREAFGGSSLNFRVGTVDAARIDIYEREQQK